jgi:hypothetical protein
MRSDIVSLRLPGSSGSAAARQLQKSPRIAGAFLTRALILSMKHGVAGNPAQPGPRGDCAMQ